MEGSKVEVKKEKMDEDEGIDWYKMKDTKLRPQLVWSEVLHVNTHPDWRGAMQLRREVS